MKASIRIEAIGDNVRQEMRLWNRILEEAAPGLGRVTFGKIPFGYWVAEITGRDPVYKYQRRFLKSKKDYSQSNRIGSRGVFLYFLLDSGRVYEVKTSRRRYFCTVNEEGEVIEMEKREVDQWINDHSVSTS
jgi:hypothetical protein